MVRQPAANPLAADASRVVELPNAIAFAREHKLPLPLSLVGIRPPAGMPHANKVGAYRYDVEGHPNLLVIFNVEDPKAAEALMVYTLHGTPTWVWVRGSLANDKLEVRPRSGGTNHVFTWSDNKGGSLSVFPASDTTSTRVIQGRFVRLDGRSTPKEFVQWSARATADAASFLPDAASKSSHCHCA